MADFSHLDQTGQARMVNISGKDKSCRVAVVEGYVYVPSKSLDTLSDRGMYEIYGVAKIAGVQAAKQTAFLIPLCHQIDLSSVQLDIHFESQHSRFRIHSRCETNSATGVEMEAFMACQVSALTIYDMIKACCPEASVGPFHLLEKNGGKLGHWQRSTCNNLNNQQ